MPIMETAEAEEVAVGLADEREALPHAKPSIADMPAEILDMMAAAITENAVANVVTLALREDGRSLRQLQSDTGLDPGNVSKLANGQNCTVATLVKLAIRLGKKVHLTIE